LEELQGVYVPAFFEPVFDTEGRLREMQAKGRRDRVRKRLVADLNRFPPPPRPLVPYCQIIHDRLTLELSRGCTRGCRYCQAGMIYRPVRERQPEAVLRWLEEAVGATGYEEASLLTLSAGDYAALPWLLESLMNRLASRRVALSLPSLRADTLTPEMMAQIQRVRRTGLTIAPEAGSQRLRQVINKNLTEEEILAAARQAFASGWQLLKLYFMIGLPRETPEDLEAIASLTRRVLTMAPRGRRPRLNVSLSGFIPKSHTPFQWERQEGLEESRGRLHAVKDRLRHSQIQTKWNSAAQSWLEGILARGDRRLAPVLLAAYRRGCRLDAWSEHLRLEPWRQAFRETEVDPDFYLRERSLEETLPWDHLDAGVSREFLASERARAYQGLETPDCRQAGCQDCGVCDGTEITVRTQEAPAAPPAEPAPLLQPSQPQWYRLTFAKLDEARWLGHLELVAAMYRSLRRSGLPLVFSDGFHPLPRVSFHGALPVGVESLAETLDVELAQRVAGCYLVETLNRALPPGFRILQSARLPRRLPPPRVASAVYQVESEEPLFNLEVAARFLARETFPVTRRRPKEEKTVDLRPLVARLEVVDAYSLQLELRHLEKDNLKVTAALAAIFNLEEDQVRGLQILKMQTNSSQPSAVSSQC
jgi:radical SAM-linked protein